MIRGFVNYPLLRYHDPFLAPLRAEPRFERSAAPRQARVGGIRGVSRLGKEAVRGATPGGPPAVIYRWPFGASRSQPS